ncbi:MAG: hypothetical protein WB662_03095 [Methyloceanibacter sp.]
MLANSIAQTASKALSSEQWDDGDRHVEELIALVGDFRVARAAFGDAPLSSMQGQRYSTHKALLGARTLTDLIGRNKKK